MTEQLKAYKIEKTRPDQWLSELDTVISGFAVTVRLKDFDELHTVRVESLETSEVKPVIEKLLKDRQALDELG